VVIAFLFLKEHRSFARKYNCGLKLASFPKVEQRNALTFHIFHKKWDCPTQDNYPNFTAIKFPLYANHWHPLKPVTQPAIIKFTE